MAAATSATANTLPMTMPTIAPADSPDALLGDRGMLKAPYTENEDVVKESTQVL